MRRPDLRPRRGGPHCRTSVVGGRLPGIGFPSLGDIPLMPETHDFEQKFLSPVRLQFRHPFEVAVGENSHDILLRSFLQELSGLVRIGRRRYGNAKKA
jgi:hypothetical protein